MLRTGFEVFFAELRRAARETRSQIQFIAAKDGPSGFSKAARTHPHAWNILLKDSERQMPARPAALCKRYGIDPLFVDDVFWMVELMESWFLADPEALAKYYGKDFSTAAIGQTEDVEGIPKTQVLRRLKDATKNTSKGSYHKVRHAPYLLERARSQSRETARRELPQVVRVRKGTT